MGQIIIDSQPIRKATKSNFLRSITQRRPPTQWAKGIGTKRERIRLQRDMINLQALLKAEAMGSLGSGYKRVFKEQAKVFEETAIAIGNGTRLRAKMLTKEWNPEEIALAFLAAILFTYNRASLNNSFWRRGIRVAKNG